MKATMVAIIILLGLSTNFSLAVKSTGEDDPCAHEQSNSGMRQCYEREQARITSGADSMANDMAAVFRKQAQDPMWEGGVVAGDLRKAASAMIASQKMWKAYRAQHCNAVAYSYTTGSGAGTAAEKCLFRLGQKRLEELSIAFK